MIMKTCSFCHQPKSLDQFYVDNRSRLGRRADCISCCALKRKGIRQREAEKYAHLRASDALASQVGESE